MERMSCQLTILLSCHINRTFSLEVPFKHNGLHPHLHLKGRAKVSLAPTTHHSWLAAPSLSPLRSFQSTASSRWFCGSCCFSSLTKKSSVPPPRLRIILILVSFTVALYVTRTSFLSYYPPRYREVWDGKWSGLHCQWQWGGRMIAIQFIGVFPNARVYCDYMRPDAAAVNSISCPERQVLWFMDSHRTTESCLGWTNESLFCVCGDTVGINLSFFSWTNQTNLWSFNSICMVWCSLLIYGK